MRLAVELFAGQFVNKTTECNFREDARRRMYWVIVGPWLAGAVIVSAAIILAYMRLGPSKEFIYVALARMALVGAILYWAWQVKSSLTSRSFYIASIILLICLLGYNLSAVGFGASDWVRISRSTIIEIFIISLSLMVLCREAWWAAGIIWLSHFVMGWQGVAVGWVQFFNELLVVSMSVAVGAVLVWRFSISERKAYIDRVNLEAARLQAEREALGKASFLANMSHEIRTPLTGVLGMLDIVLDANLPKQQHEELLETRDCANNLLVILNDVLDYSKIEAQGITLKPTSVATGKLIQRAEKLFKATARAKHTKLETQVEELPRYLHIDETRFGQVLSNLVGNAVKFTDHGTVQICAKWLPDQESDRAGQLQIEVKDSGVGISTEAQTRLFGRFVQAEENISDQFGGTGLGLSISKEIIAAMQGQIGVTSVEGRGSTFWFHIPCEIGTPGGQTNSDAGENSNLEVAKTEGGLKLLVADDNPVNRKIVAAYLDKAGHQSVLVEDGNEAIDAVKQEAFDAVLMDVNMPNLGGIEAMQAIRKLSQPLASIPIVALTADTLDEDRKALLNAGMDGFVGKPIDQSELHSVLAQISNPH